MSGNAGFKTFDRVADFTNFLAILSVGRNLVTVSRALKEAGFGISDAALGQMTEKDVATGRYAAEVFNPAEGILNAMPVTVALFAEFELALSIALIRYDRLRSPRSFNDARSSALS